jgi:Kef-type K+ transport system membrane component KefB
MGAAPMSFDCGARVLTERRANSALAVGSPTRSPQSCMLLLLPMSLGALIAANFSSPTVVLAGAGASPLVQELGLCLLVAGVLSALFERMRIPTIAALLVAGVVLGPVGLGLIHSTADIETIANLGLTLLLFVIGLEVNPRSLLASGRTLLLTGALQVPITAAVALGAFLALRPLLSPHLDGRYTPLYLALACAFSSTLLVVRFLQERRVLDTISGRLAVGLLIFQDIWAIIILAVQPSFESPQVMPIVLTFAGIFLVVALATLGARFVLPRLFAAVAKAPELMVSLALAWCFAVGLTGGHLGGLLALFGVHAEISVSMELGALIAGMTIASFPYHHEVAAKVSYLRDFFVTLFFVALGMSIPIPDGAHVLALALLLAVVAVLLRFVVFLPVFYFAGLDRNNALDASTKLAQISEFCLVIAYLGVKAGHLAEATASIVIFAFIITALITPLLFSIATTLPLRLGPFLSRLGFKEPSKDRASIIDGHHQPSIVILGFHRVAAALLQDIGRQRPELLPSIIVVDINVQTHATIKQQGVRVLYGDAGSPDTLRHAGVPHAQLVISTIPDELLRGTSNEAIVRAIRQAAPNVSVFACASRAGSVDLLYAAGATYVYMPSAETANGVFEAGMATLEGQLDGFRATREAACGPLQTRLDVDGMSI